MCHELMHSLAGCSDRHADETLPRLAAEVPLSPTHLQRIFKAVVGVSPNTYQDAAWLATNRGVCFAPFGRSEAERAGRPA